MKKIFKIAAASLVASACAFTLCTGAFAADDSSVTFNGHNKGFDFKPGSEYSATDLFDNFKNCMPGDSLTETITVTNASGDSDYIALYVRALPHDEETNPLSDSLIAAGETVASMTDFLSKLHMRVLNGDSVIFDVSPDQLEGMEENVLIGNFEKGESTTLTVELTVPLDLSNEYADRVGEVDWLFVTESFDYPEPEKPDDDLIQTGAKNLPVPVLAVLGSALIVLGAVFVSKKKENEDA